MKTFGKSGSPGVSSCGRGTLPIPEGRFRPRSRRPYGSAHGATCERSDLRCERGGSSPSAEGCQRGLLGAARCMADRACPWGLGRIRIAARLAQLPLDAPVRGQLHDPAPRGPGVCSIPSSIPSLRPGGEDRLPLAGRQRHRQWHWQRHRHDPFARLESEGHRATARSIAEHLEHTTVDEPGHDHNDRGADRLTWESAQRQ